MAEAAGVASLERVKALIPFREALGEIREGWRRARYRRALDGVPFAVPAGGIHVSYGGVQPRGPEETVRGGRVKLLHLQEVFPAREGGFNILYLVSSAQPRFAAELADWARARGVRVVWNQDGVAYPAWAGRSYARLNARTRAAMRAASYVLYQSEFCRASADRYLGPAPVPWEVLYNCVDTQRFRPAAEPLPPEPWTLLAAGTHQQRERVLSALETAAVLRRRGAAVRLLLAGVPDWPGAGADVPEVVRRLGLGREVEILGPYSQAEAPALFRRAHVLLHPKYKDPSPTVPLEAMASGVPVVGSRSGGMPELVEPDGGLLVEVPDSWDVMHVPDPAAMAEAVAAIMADWARWSRRARQWVEARFRKDAWLRRHREIFARLLGQGGAPA